MPGMGLVTVLALSFFSAGPQWPDLIKQPLVTGGGEKDAALVVAVEDYAYLPDVVGAGDLGTAWFMYLSKVRKVPGVMLLQNGDATPIKIRSSLEKAAERVKAGGRVWFVFIGHGSPSQDRKDGALVGVTAQADQYDFFPHTVTRGEVLQKLAPRVSGVLPPVLILDACFSGTDGEGKTLIAGAQFAVSEELAETAAAKEATILTAGRAKDIAGQLPGASRPAFSYLVLGALRGWGDANGDGTVTAQEAVEYARDALLTLDSGRQQSPQASGVDQALTMKLSGSALEQGPDLAEMRMQLGGTAVGGGAKVQDDLARELAALEKARREREDAERREVAAREAASKRHKQEVDEAWAAVLAVAKGGGPEGRKAVEIFLKRYQDHPLGNPKEAEAREMLERLGATTGAAMKGYILVKPGCFQMGSPSSEEGRDSDETQHEVCITRGYFLKETEVTQGEWKALMGSSPSYFSSCGSNCPVERVSWFEAVAYANALSKKEGLEQCYTVSGCSGTLGGGCGSEISCDGDYKCSDVSFKGVGCKGYRLPTEAEWEYAARAGSRTSTYAGELKILGDSNGPVLDAIAWYGGNSGVSYPGAYDCSDWKDKQYSSSTCGTHAVQQKKANAWGFYDLLGNVLEWTWDWYGDYGTMRNDPLGASTGSNRVFRGGSWGSGARYVRAANRGRDVPGVRGGDLGFRLCRSQLN